MDNKRSPCGMTRLRPVDHSREYGHISRVDGDRKLIERATQDVFFVELCAQHSLKALTDDKEDDLPDSPSADSCLSSLRKLREGVVASGRKDVFAIDVFERTVRYAVVANHVESYVPAMRYLITTLYPETRRKIHTGRAVLESLYLLHLLSTEDYLEFMNERATLDRRHCVADNILRAHVQGNWIALERLKQKITFLESKMLAQNFAKLADQAVSTIEAAYLAVDSSWLQRASGDQWKARMKNNSKWSIEGTRLTFKRPGKAKISSQESASRGA